MQSSLLKFLVRREQEEASGKVRERDKEPLKYMIAYRSYNICRRGQVRVKRMHQAVLGKNKNWKVCMMNRLIIQSCQYIR